MLSTSWWDIASAFAGQSSSICLTNAEGVACGIMWNPIFNNNRLSKLHLNCREWLHCLPDECLPPKTIRCSNSSLPFPGPHPIFSEDEISYLNIDLCILALQRVQIPCNKKSNLPSYATPSQNPHTPSSRNESLEQLNRTEETNILRDSDKIRESPISTAGLDI